MKIENENRFNPQRAQESDGKMVKYKEVNKGDNMTANKNTDRWSIDWDNLDIEETRENYKCLQKFLLDVEADRESVKGKCRELEAEIEELKKEMDLIIIWSVGSREAI